MSRRAKEAYENAFGYERDYGNCAQATLKALMDVFDSDNETAYRGLGSFAGGGAAEGDGSCGAYVGGLFFIGMRTGRRFADIGKDTEDPAASKIAMENRRIAKMLHEKFIDKYGTVVCHQIQRRLFGRVYYTPDPDQYDEFLRMGGHETVCPSVCGDAACWTVELIESLENQKQC
jgi:C_GCAxxG_C_C family probable redox protein